MAWQRATTNTQYTTCFIQGYSNNLYVAWQISAILMPNNNNRLSTLGYVILRGVLDHFSIVDVENKSDALQDPVRGVLQGLKVGLEHQSNSHGVLAVLSHVDWSP